MRTSWTVVAAVCLVGAGAGTLIAGIPGQDEPFVLDASAASTTDVAALDLVSSLPSVTPTTNLNAPTTTQVASAAPVPPTTMPPTTVAASTTLPITTDLVGAIRERSAVRLVLANGDGRFNLVGSNAARLLAGGYVTIEQEDVLIRPASTLIYYRSGFEQEAVRMSVDLQTPNALIEPLPATAVTGSDIQGDLVVVLGPDALS